MTLSIMLRQASLQRVAALLEFADALLELDDIRRFGQIGFAAALFSGFEPVAQFFDDVGDHDASPRTSMNPRWIGHQGFPVKGLTRIIAVRIKSASEMPESSAFRFGMVQSLDLI